MANRSFAIAPISGHRMPQRMKTEKRAGTAYDGKNMYLQSLE
jgi:hypothetical protein